MLAPGADRDTWLDRLQNLASLLARADRAHASHSALVDVIELDGAPVAIKRFPGRPRWKRATDRYRGTPASRAFEAALYLQQHGIPTARPIAVVDSEARGGEGLLVTAWLANTCSFKEALIAAYTHGADSPHIMALLQNVARAVRGLHDAGVFHRDLGNQNILLEQAPDGRYGAPCFIDLNRARLQTALTMRQRAFDLARIHLPSDFRRIFIEMYFDARAPQAFVRAERYYRRRFTWHTATRRYRHPLRTWRQRGQSHADYPPLRELWVWDPCSVQAIAALRGRERRRLMCKRDWLRMALHSIRHATAVRRAAHDLLKEAYATPVVMQGRIGLAISDTPALAAFEDRCLAELAGVHILARFYAHQPEAAWTATAQRLQRLHTAGHSLTIVLVQDRRCVSDPGRWCAFVRTVLGQVGAIVEAVQVGQALNRTKWGIWSFAEYATLAEIAAAEARRYPSLALLGPAVIDYEPHYLLGALASLPPDVHFDGVGHLLYVDRRGAPENRQGRHATLEKLATLRAIAQLSPRTDDRLVITETNWPLKDTGIYSPICSPYLFSGQTVDGGVDETTYGHYMIRYQLIALCSGLAERVCWWRLCAHGFGLVDDRDPSHPRPRPAYAMLRQFLVMTQGATFTGRPATPEGLHAFRFERADGSVFHIVYAQDGAADRRAGIDAARVEDACGNGLTDYQGLAPESGAPIYLFDHE